MTNAVSSSSSISQFSPPPAAPCLGAFLVIQFIISAVMLLLRPEESILISGTLLPFHAAFILFALTQRLVLVDFQNRVRMGRTRRKMLGLTLAPDRGGRPSGQPVRPAPSPLAGAHPVHPAVGPSGAAARRGGDGQGPGGGQLWDPQL